ncbi:MAG: hypothetical protein ACNS60_15400, partial [Candidatus Cyclobacteriaceae bacterium M2_1C_046]
MIPKDKVDEACEVIKEQEPMGVWTDDQTDGNSMVRVLIDANRTENLSDKLSEKFSSTDGFRIMLFTVEATLPQPKIEEEKEDDEAD